MASPPLRLVGGRDFPSGAALRREPTGANRSGGWPLSPDLLAALHAATPANRWCAENAVRAVLDMPFLPRP